MSTDREWITPSSRTSQSSSREIACTDPELASYLRIEERELKRELRRARDYRFCPGDQRGLALALGVRVRAR
jgi:hypothetical protein